MNELSNAKFMEHLVEILQILGQDLISLAVNDNVGINQSPHG